MKGPFGLVLVLALGLFWKPSSADGPDQVVEYLTSVARPNMEQLGILEKYEAEKEATRSDWFYRGHICHRDTFLHTSATKEAENPYEKCIGVRHGLHTCMSKVRAASGRQIERKREYRCCTGYYLPPEGYECIRRNRRYNSREGFKKKFVPED